MLLLCVLHKSGLAIGRATVNFSFAQQMVLPLFQSLLTSLAGGQNGTLGRVGSPSLLFVAVVVGQFNPNPFQTQNLFGVTSLPTLLLPED